MAKINLEKKQRELDEKNFSEYAFEREYEKAVVAYYQIVLEMIIYGFAEKIGADPSKLKKSIDLENNDLLLKAFFDEVRKKSFFVKKLWEKFGFGRKKWLRKKRWEPKPIKIKGKFIYKPDGDPIQEDEWKNLEDSIVEFLGASNIEEETVTRGFMFGKLIEQMERQKKKPEEQKAITWDQLEKLYGEVPNNLRDAKNWIPDKDSRTDLEYAKEKSLIYLSTSTGEIKTKLINILRGQITDGIRNGLSPQQLTQNLFWADPTTEFGRLYSGEGIEGLNRNWERIAKTEMAFAKQEGYLSAVKASLKKKESAYFIFAGGIKYGKVPKSKATKKGGYGVITCQYCMGFLGKVVKLLDKMPESGSDIANDDSYADFYIWPGKNNVGRRAPDWWITNPVHPNCHHFWKRIDPAIEEYDKETDTVDLKIASAKTSVMDLLKSRGELVRRTITDKNGVSRRVWVRPDKGKKIPRRRLKRGAVDVDKRQVEIEGIKLNYANLIEDFDITEVYRTEHAHAAYKGKTVLGKGRYYSLDEDMTKELTLDPNSSKREYYSEDIHGPIDKYKIKKDRRVLIFDFENDQDLRNWNELNRRVEEANVPLDLGLREIGINGVITRSESLNFGGDQLVLYGPKANQPKKIKESMKPPLEQEAKKYKTVDEFIESQFANNVEYYNIYGNNVEVIKNPTSSDYKQLNKEYKSDFPNSTNSESKVRSIYDSKGNTYLWRADKATHNDIKTLIEKRNNVKTSQSTYTNDTYSKEKNIKDLTEIYNKAHKEKIKKSIQLNILDFLIARGKATGIFIKGKYGKKTFVPTPMNKVTKKVDFNKIPNGMSVWITVNGKHVPITRFGDQFAVDVTAAASAGYSTKGIDKDLAHLSFSLEDVKKRSASEVAKKQKEDKKPLTEKQAERKRVKEEAKTEKKKIKKDLRKDKNKSLRDLKEIIYSKKNQVKDKADLERKLDRQADRFGLSEEQKGVYIKELSKEITKRREANLVEKLKNRANDRDIDISDMNHVTLVKPPKTDSMIEFIAEIKIGLGSEEGKKLSIRMTELKGKPDEIKEKYSIYKRSIAKENKFRKEISKARVENVNKVLEISKDSLKISEADLKAASDMIGKVSGTPHTESIYSMMSEFWEDGLGHEINYISQKTGIMNLNGILGQFANFTVDISRMAKSIGTKTASKVVAAYLRNTRTKTQFDSITNRLQTYFEDERDLIETNVINKIKNLKEKYEKLEKNSKGTYSIQMEEYKINNLIEQRNAIGTAHGMLSSTADFLSTLKSMNKPGFKPQAIDIELSNDLETAKFEMKKFAYSKDKKKVELISKGIFGKKNVMRIKPDMLETYVKKMDIDRREISKLNRLKRDTRENRPTNKDFFDPKIKGPDGKEISVMKEGMNFRAVQRNDALAIMEMGGSGIISRTVGGGKTLTLAAIHALNMEKDPDHVTLVSFPSSAMEQQFEEYKEKTNLRILKVPDGMYNHPRKLKKFMEGANGAMVLISHDEMAKAPVAYGKEAGTFAGDEFHKMIINERGELRNKAKEIRKGIKYANKIITTATLFRDNPADIYNALKICIPDLIPDKINFRDMVGRRDIYDVEGKPIEGNHSISDMSLGRSNLMEQTYRDLTDRFVTYDTEVKAKTGRERTKSKLTAPEEMIKQVDTELYKMNIGTHTKASMKGYKNYVYDISPSRQAELKVSIPDYAKGDKRAPIWDNPKIKRELGKRRERYIKKVTKEKMRMMNSWEDKNGNPNPKTQDIVKRVSSHSGPQIIYVDDKNHMKHIQKHLIASGVDKNNMVDKVKRFQEEGRSLIKEWEKKDSGILFISKGDEEGLNLQRGDKLHVAGTVGYGMTQDQLEGRIFRDPRTTDAEVIHYSFDTGDDQFNEDQHSKWIQNVSSLDQSKQSRAEIMRLEEYMSPEERSKVENRKQYEEFLGVMKEIGRIQ